MNASYSTKYEYTILPSPQGLEQIPAGEITSGFRLEQAIDWNMRNTSKLKNSDTLCVDVLFANYGDRDNSGNFSLSLQIGHFSQKIIRSAHQVTDNVYQRFCFDKFYLKDIAHKPSTLLLEGIDSPPGKAVTVWMTSDTTLGKARREDRETDKSLIFFVDVQTASNNKRMHAIILTLLCCLSVSALFWPKKSKLR